MISPAATIAQSTQQGSIAGAWVAVPAAAASCAAQAAMDATDVLAGPPGQRTVILGLEWSYDGGRSASPAAQETWTSGPTDLQMDGHTPAPPAVSTSVPTDPIPSHARAYLSLPAPTFVGVDLVFSDASGTEI